jgi:hypothetical protein
MHQIVLTVKWYLLLELHKAGKPYKGWFDPMKGPKPIHKPEGYVPVDPIFLK